MNGRLLVVDDDARAILAIKRALARADVAEVLGAHSRAAAHERLQQDPNLHAVLLHWGSQDAMRLAFELAAGHDDLVVVAFNGDWREADQRRAVQLGVAALLYAPLDGGEATAELRAVLAGGESPSRARLLRTRGPQLLAPDPSLWAVEDDDEWRARMGALADNVRERWLTDTRARARALRERLEAVMGGRLPAATLRALLALAERGADRVDDVAAHYGVEPGLLGRLWARLARFAASTGGHDGLVVLLRAEAARARDAELRGHSAVLAELHAAARGSLGRAADAPRPDPFATRLTRALALPPALAHRLPTAVVRALAGRILNETQEACALEHARLTLLQALLSAALVRPPDALDLEVLAGLLGLNGREGLSTGQALEALGELNPAPAWAALHLDALPAVSAALVDAPGEVAQALRAEIAGLLAADRPAGSLDQRRLQRLARAFESDDAEALVGPLALRAFDRALAAPDHLGTRPALERLLFAVGARGLGDAGTLRGALAALGGPKARALPAQVLRGALVAALRGDDPREALGAEAAHTPAPDPAALERARLAEAVRDLPGVGDLDALAAALPPPLTDGGRVPPVERERLRALSVLLQRRGGAERDALLASALPPDVPVDHLVQLARHAQALGDGGTEQSLARRLGIDGGGRSVAEVLALLDAGRVDAAWFVAARLPDYTPDLVDALNAVGLALYEAERAGDSAPVYRRALRLAPDRLNVLFNAARALFDAGAPELALPLARRALDLSPHLTPARTLLERIEAALRG